jgi:hypothetical protein
METWTFILSSIEGFPHVLDNVIAQYNPYTALIILSVDASKSSFESLAEYNNFLMPPIESNQHYKHESYGGYRWLVDLKCKLSSF